MPKNPPSEHVLSHGGIKHSRLKSHGFTWKYATERALQHQYYRSIQLARTNIDYQVKYPNECKNHQEAEKRLLKEHELILKNSLVPTVDRPMRMSKSG